MSGLTGPRGRTSLHHHLLEDSQSSEGAVGLGEPRLGGSHAVPGLSRVFRQLTQGATHLLELKYKVASRKHRMLALRAE